MKQKLFKTMLLLCALIVGSGTAWAESKVTDVANIEDGGHYFIGCTVSETDYYLYVNPTSSEKGQKKATTDEATEFIFTSGTNGGWYIQIASSGKYITLPSSKDNAKVNVQDDPAEWEATNVSSLIQLKINGYLLQGNSGTSLNFGSYQSGQINVWLEKAGSSASEKEVTFSYEDYKGEGTLNYGSEYSMIKTDVRITHNLFYCSDTYPQAFFYGYGGVTDGLITITPSNGATITKIEFITPQTDYNGYQDGGTITPSTGTVSANKEDKTQATITTWTGSADTQFTITNTKTILWTSIIVTYTGGLPQCATPVISGETPFVTYSTVTITCATEGASIQYCTSTDGVTYTDYQFYTAPFQISESKTVKAKATKEGMVPSVAYKGFTQQGSAPNIRYFISDRAMSGTLEFIRLEDALVTYKNGKYAYLEDAYGAIMLYNCASDLAAGDKINGYMHVTGYTVYNNLPEITGYELVEGYVKSAEPEVKPTVMTLEQLLGDPAASPYEMYLSKYIKIENATVTSAFSGKECTIEQGGYSIVLRDQNSSATLTSTAGDNVTVTGHVAIFGTTNQIAVYVQDQIVVSAAPAVPTITVTPSSLTGFTYVEGNGPSAAQTITVSGTNLTADITLDMTTGKYEMSLSEADGYTNKLTLTPSAGEVAATTIYVRLKADMPVNASYGGEIAITSTGATTKYVNLSGSVTKPTADYATLPFEYDGNCTGELPAGLTQEGLGTKTYASSPKIGFDTTGDNLVLKINEAPGKLTFDVKGNGFSGGTFKVQTSVDGVEYTDLATYTELGATQNEEFDLATTVRYIKWVYTEKSSGNVALGNIKLAKYVEPSTDAYINVAETKIKAPAEGKDGTIIVAYENIKSVVAEVFFCDAEGKAAATYDWVTAEINEKDNVYYIIGKNESTEARTAYMKVYALDDDANDVYSELITITQDGYVKATTYTLASSITPGKHYIIVGEKDGSYKAMGAQKSNNRAAVNVTENAGTIAVTTDVCEFVIYGPDASRFYTLYDVAKGYLYAASSSNNYLKSQTTNDINGKWVISIDPGSKIASIFADGSSNRNVMQYNSSSTLFSCYASASQSPVYLYEKEGDTPVATTTSVTLNKYGYATFASTSTLDFLDADKATYGAFELTGVSDSKITFNQITETVAAGTGILLKGNASEIITLNILPAGGATLSGNKFVGITTPTDISAGQYYGLSGDKFVKVGAGTVPAGKALLPASEVGSSIKAFNFVFEDDPDGINSIDNGELTIDNAAIYNLAGQRLSKMQKGINIVNGKKILY